MTSMKIGQFWRLPSPLSSNVQNSSTPLTLDVQFQTKLVMAKIQFSLIKKIKIGRPEHSLTSPPVTSYNISFLPYPTHTTLKVYVMCITPWLFAWRSRHIRLLKKQIISQQWVYKVSISILSRVIKKILALTVFWSTSSLDNLPATDIRTVKWPTTDIRTVKRPEDEVCFECLH